MSAVMFMIPPKEILQAESRREQLFLIFRQIGFARCAVPEKINSLLKNRETMLSREDFIFTIGYDGPVAVVDKQAKKKFGHLNTKELAERGLFRAAYSSALYSNDSQELQFVAEAYNQMEKHSQVEINALEKLFGVSMVDVRRSISL